MKKFFTLIAALSITFGVAGCAPASPQVDVYSQKIAWTACANKIFQCGTVKVPVDWSKPSGDTIELALARKVTKNAIGSLVINPGGPGGSGVDFLVNNYDNIGTSDLRSKYTYVSFDPRGVGQSSAIACLDAKGTDHLLYDSTNATPGSAEDMALTRAELKKFDDSCKKNSGPVLGHVDTSSAAKDMDVIRASMGYSKLDYLGFSYGTLLGSTYAALFPSKVGHLVLDGAIDPRVTDEQQNLNQLKGFNLALNDYLKDCLSNDPTCPFHGSLASAQKGVSKFLRALESKTLPTKDGRKLSITSASTGLIMALYSDSYWPYLTQAFNQALKSNDGSGFILLADFYNDRDQSGKYSSNTLEANIAINCLDSRSSTAPAAMAAQNQRLLQVSPILGRYWQNGALTCEQWPFPVAKHPTSYAAKGAPTIMVVGTTGDPATPYEQAVGLAHEVLSKGFLVTFKGEGHTAYGRSNECVSTAVDDFFIKGVLPQKEPVC